MWAAALVAAALGPGCPQALVQFPGGDSGEVGAAGAAEEVALVELSSWAVVGEAADEAVGGAPGMLLAGPGGGWGAAVVPAPSAVGGAGLVALHGLDAAGERGLRAGGLMSGSPGAGLGAALAWVSGKNGRALLAVGAPGESAVYLVSAGVSELRLEQEQRLALQLPRAGAALSSADLDNDGLADLAVGGPGDDDDLGWVGVHLGGEAGLGALPDLELVGLEPGDQAGAALAAADLSGDGAVDLLICAPGYDTDESNVGACALMEGGALFGRGQGDLRAQAAGFYLGAARGDRVGDGADGLALADLDGDGRADLTLGSPSAGGGDGLVAVFYGDRPPGLRTVADADLLLRGADGFGQAIAALPASGAAPGRLVVSAGTSGSVWLLPPLLRGERALAALGVEPLASGPPSDRLGASLSAAWAEGGALLLIGAPGVNAAGFGSGALEAAPLSDLQLGR